MGNKDLAAIKSNTLSLVPISKPTDLLKAKPVLIQRKESGDELVLTEIRLALEKCAMGLGIRLEDSQAAIICSDLMDVYSHDSIEDIQQCFKKGRQGKYPFGHHKRDQLTMPLIREWMMYHLEDKASEREKVISERKNQKPEPMPEEVEKYLSDWKESIKVPEGKVKKFEDSEEDWESVAKEDHLVRGYLNKKRGYEKNTTEETE